jgi:hypothetical protein
MNREAQRITISRTLLYRPLTAILVVFCNAIVTSHIGDFHLLKTMADCLTQCGAISQSIAKLQNLFEEFVSLSQPFLDEESSTLFANQHAAQMSLSLQQGTFPRSLARDPNSPCWINTGSNLNLGTLTGLDGRPLDELFPVLDLPYGVPSFYSGQQNWHTLISFYRNLLYIGFIVWILV